MPDTSTKTKQRLAAQITDYAVQAALSVAPYLRAAAGTVGTHDTKHDIHDPVTVHDKAVEGDLHRFLGGAIPGSRVLGEEMGEQNLPALLGTEPLSEDAQFLGSRVRWIIDPIDGTANFATGGHYFGTSIAAELDGEIVAGVVSLPMSDEVFAANLDEAWLLTGGKRSQLDCSGPTEESTATISSYYPGPWNLESEPAAALARFTELSTAYMGFRRTGAGAVDLANVAAGRLSCVLGMKFGPWDVAAGMHLVKVAGGGALNLPLGTTLPEGLRPGILAWVGTLEPTIARGVLEQLEAQAR